MSEYIEPVKYQAIGSIVQQVNEQRLRELESQLAQISKESISELSNQDRSFATAVEQIESIREFLRAPEHILGSEGTKHGEIAEHVEVGIRNAESIIKGGTARSTFDGVARTAPEDYRLDGVNVQSKFINGTNNNLDHVLKHMKTYPSFVKDGSYYHVPRDTFDTITKVRNGQAPSTMSERQRTAILRHIEEIESKSGRPFEDIVRPSVSTYRDVQKGNIDKTLNRHEQSIEDENIRRKNEIRKDAQDKQVQAEKLHAPSFKEGLKVGAVSAAIAGGTQIAVLVYQKHKEGKRIVDFDMNDWKDVGVDFATGGLKGGISASALYALTNYSSMSAPMAGAYVSAVLGVSKLFVDYTKGDIEYDDFVEQGEILCLETGFVALGAVAGQAIIPIPILGAAVGGFAAKILGDVVRKHHGKANSKLEARVAAEYDRALAKMSVEYQTFINQIVELYQKRGTITAMAFNFELNEKLRFSISQTLAMEHGVPSHKLLHNLSEIDAFMMGD